MVFNCPRKVNADQVVSVGVIRRLMNGPFPSIVSGLIVANPFFGSTASNPTKFTSGPVLFWSTLPVKLCPDASMSLLKKILVSATSALMKVAWAVVARPATAQKTVVRSKLRIVRNPHVSVRYEPVHARTTPVKRYQTLALILAINAAHLTA